MADCLRLNFQFGHGCRDFVGRIDLLIVNDTVEAGDYELAVPEAGLTRLVQTTFPAGAIRRLGNARDFAVR